jgi:ABC-type branched-subunit amino acid transport system substrate-binding protein
MRSHAWWAAAWLVAALVAVLVVPRPAWAADGVSDTEIRLGASVVLSGPLGPQTAEYGAGARLYFDTVNAAGGVHGRRISYKTLDDGFDVERAQNNTRRLLDEDKVFAVFNNTGTAHTAAILPLAAEAGRIVFGPVTGATSLRRTYNRLLFHVRAGYADEAARIAGQLHEVGITRVAAFYQDDGLGKALLAEVREAAAARKLQLHETRLDPARPDFAAAAAELARAQPQAVVMCTAGVTFTNLVKALGATGARPSIYGFSVTSLDTLGRELGPAARGIVLAQSMPSLVNRSAPVVMEFLALSKQAADDGAAPSLARFEGFVHAKLFVEGLRRAGRNLTTDSLVRAFETAGEISYGRFSVNYSPRSHNGSSYVELAIVDQQGRLRY